MEEYIVKKSLERHASKELLDAVAWIWAEHMADAIMKKRLGAPRDLYAGTLHNSGKLQDVIVFIDRAAKSKCGCREQAEKENAGDSDWYWQDNELDHDSDCLPILARILLMKLKSADKTQE